VVRERNGDKEETEEKSDNKPSDIAESVMVPSTVARPPCIVRAQLRADVAEDADFPKDPAGKLICALIDHWVLELEVHNETETSRGQNAEDGKRRGQRIKTNQGGSGLNGGEEAKRCDDRNHDVQATHGDVEGDQWWKELRDVSDVLEGTDSPDESPDKGDHSGEDYDGPESPLVNTGHKCVWRRSS